MRRLARTFGIRSIGLTAIVVLLTGSGVLADSLGEIRMKYSSVSPGQSARIYLDGDSLGTVSTGQYNLKVDAGYSGTWGEGQTILDMADSNWLIGAFCADVVQSVPGYYTIYDVNMPQSAPVGGANSTLLPGGMGSDKATDLRRLFANNLSSVAGDNVAAAAFQLSLWEIIYENTDEYDVSGYHYGDRGSFYAKENASAITLANDWLGDVSAGMGEADLELRVLTNPCKQDYSIILPAADPPSGVIPEPLTVLALTGAVAAVGAYVRRRRRAEA